MGKIKVEIIVDVIEKDNTITNDDFINSLKQLITGSGFYGYGLSFKIKDVLHIKSNKNKIK